MTPRSCRGRRPGSTSMPAVAPAISWRSRASGCRREPPGLATPTSDPERRPRPRRPAPDARRRAARPAAVLVPIVLRHEPTRASHASAPRRCASIRARSPFRAAGSTRPTRRSLDGGLPRGRGGDRSRALQHRSARLSRRLSVGHELPRHAGGRGASRRITSLTLNPHEVAETFEVPLRFLMNPGHHDLHSKEWQGRIRHYYAMPYDESLHLGRHRRDRAQPLRAAVHAMTRVLFGEMLLFLLPFCVFALYLLVLQAQSAAVRPLEPHPPCGSPPPGLSAWCWLCSSAACGPSATPAPTCRPIWRTAASCPGSSADDRPRPPRPRRRSSHDRPLRRLLETLDGDGEETRIVGGAVRNALLGRPVADVDLRDDRLAGRDHSAAPRPPASRRFRPGIEHGTVTVVVDGEPFEVTTLREDVETDGRHAVVRFGRDFAADAHRRDFTINALSLGPDGTPPRLHGRPRRSRRPAGPLHRRRGNAHPRGLPAHPALLPLSRRLCGRAARPRTGWRPPAGSATGSRVSRGSGSGPRG